jgi:hypothetical protein
MICLIKCIQTESLKSTPSGQIVNPCIFLRVLTEEKEIEGLKGYHGTLYLFKEREVRITQTLR